MTTQEQQVSLIVNADDFGLTAGVNRGIIHAHKSGIVTSATLMANMPFAGDAIDRAADCPNLGLGLHINLTTGYPVCPAAQLDSLVDPEGRLPGLVGLLARVCIPSVRTAIRREVTAQLEKVLAAGADISHLDGHKHIHVHPAILPTIIAVAKDHGIRAIRIPVEDGGIRTGADGPGTRNSTTRVLVVSLLARRAKRVLKCEGLIAADHFFGIARTGD